MMRPQHKTVCLFVLFLHLAIHGYSQQKKYNFTFKDAPLETVIREIANQSKNNILYNPAILPHGLKITGAYRNLTLKQALDSFLRPSQVYYRFYKGDIVLYRKNEEVKETHKIAKPVNKDPVRETITDTVTYSIITFDTIVSQVKEYVKVPVYDTIRVKVYDTVHIRQTVPVQSFSYRPKQSGFILGASFAQAFMFSRIEASDSMGKLTGALKSALKEKGSNSLGLSFIYKNEKWMFESGVYWTKHKYTFNYSTLIKETVTVTDTADRYYTHINGLDTTWVYVIQERQLERSTEKVYYSDFSYQFISVPLLAGYTSTVRNFTFEFKAGMVFNFYFKSKGYYLKPLANNAIGVEEGSAPNAGLTLSVMGAAAIDYSLNKQFHLFGQPFITWDALPLGDKNTLYKTSTLQIGLQAGIRYYF
ncbi:MAG TPA: STN domain-containing protein [Bacteroidales bacterium]|nr:STN domain-containing protein [Bacteroidales bacterium]